MYPNAIVSFNIFATTMIGKVIIPPGTITNNYDDDLGKEYVDDLIQNDPCFIGHKWHNLSSFDTLYVKLNKRFGRS